MECECKWMRHPKFLVTIVPSLSDADKKQLGAALNFKNPDDSSSDSGSSSGSSDSSGSSSSAGSTGGNSSSNTPSTDDKITAWIAELLDENEELFFPKTILPAVFTVDGERLDGIIESMDDRIAKLEVSTGSGNDIRVADNLLTPSKTIALSAKQGKMLYDILSNADGVVTTDGEKLTIGYGKIDGNMIDYEVISSEHIKPGAVTTEKIDSFAVCGGHIAPNAITKDKLVNSLRATIETIESIDSWKEEIEARLDVLENSMSLHQANDTLIKEQNLFLLNEHQKMKKLETVLKFYNETTDEWIEDTIGIDDILMSKLKIKFKWHYYDEIDNKDYKPKTFKFKAVITSEDDSVREVVLSTDSGLNNVEREYGLTNLKAGDTIEFKTSVNYCWLDWNETKTLEITE